MQIKIKINKEKIQLKNKQRNNKDNWRQINIKK